MHNKILNILLILVVSPIAFAEVTDSNSSLSSIIMLSVIFLMIYFLLIRPQNKKAKEHQQLLSNLTSGDEIITQGGLVGTITRDADAFFLITLTQGVEVFVQKQSIVQQLPKGTLKSL